MQLFPNLGFWPNINIATGVIESREGAESNFYFVDKIRAIKVGDELVLFGEPAGMRLCLFSDHVFRIESISPCVFACLRTI